MDSPRRGGTSGADATGRDAPEDGPAETPVEATRPTPPAPGRESLREAVHRRMRELDEHGAEKPAPDAPDDPDAPDAPDGAPRPTS